MDLLDIFSTAKPVIGMLHVPALPGAPQQRLRFDEIAQWVLRDAAALVEGGVDRTRWHSCPCSPRRCAGKAACR